MTGSSMSGPNFGSVRPRSHMGLNMVGFRMSGPTLRDEVVNGGDAGTCTMDCEESGS